MPSEEFIFSSNTNFLAHILEFSTLRSEASVQLQTTKNNQDIWIWIIIDECFIVRPYINFILFVFTTKIQIVWYEKCFNLNLIALLTHSRQTEANSTWGRDVLPEQPTHNIYSVDYSALPWRAWQSSWRAPPSTVWSTSLVADVSSDSSGSV